MLTQNKSSSGSAADHLSSLAAEEVARFTRISAPTELVVAQFQIFQAISGALPFTY